MIFKLFENNLKQFIYCLGLKPDKSFCLNSRDIKYGDYCKSCYTKGWRPDCSAIVPNGDQCFYKAKSNGYCGNHLNYEEKMKEKEEKEEKRKRDKAISISIMSIEKEEIIIYTKEEHERNLLDEKINKSRIEEVLLYRQELINETIQCKDKNKLLIIKNPNLIYEWNFEKNIEIGLDIKKIKRGTDKKAWWKCPDNSHETYLGIIHLKTSGKGANCKECRLESIGLSKEKREKKRKQ